VPPPPPGRRAQSESESDTDPGIDGDTKVVANAFAHDPEFAPTATFESFDSADDDEGAESGEPLRGPGDPAARAQAQAAAASGGIDDTALLELSATTVATNIDMDWDEEDVQTELRDEHSSTPDLASSTEAAPLLKPIPGSASSPFSSARPRASASPPGNPSPFGPPRSSVSGPPPALASVFSDAESWEDEDDALTRVRPSGAPLPGAGTWPPPQMALPASAALPTFDEEPDFVRRGIGRDRMAWAALAAAALVVAAVGARALLAPPDPATVTLVTEPADAEVVVDGRALAGQTSPFTVQGLAADVQHVIDVRKTGYSPQSYRFSIGSGEVKALPSIDLAPVRVDTGFALQSAPSGAAIYVDGKKLDHETPARVTDLAQGLHLIRLEQPGGRYQPWETQVALATGQVIELPVAHLVPVSGGASTKSTAFAKSAPQDEPRVAKSSRSSGSRKTSARSSSRSSRTTKQVAAPRPVRTVAPARVAAPPPTQVASSGGGRAGTLRINSRPWAQVFVDGRLIGNTPQLNIPLSAGSHDVKLVNPQLGMRKGFGVKIRAGKVTTKIVELIN
jgi:hypothetical protein